MSKKTLTPTNLLSLAAAPTIPTLSSGDTYFDTTLGVRTYNGSSWVSAGYSTINLGSTALTSGATVTTVAGLTLTTPTINGAALSGTFSGNPTFSGSTIFSKDLVVNGTTFGSGNNISPGPVAIGASALAGQVTTGVLSLGTVTGGSGYTNGTYTNVTLTYVSGTTMTIYPTANITVSGGVVTATTLLTTGSGGSTSTVLSAAAANIGGTGSGFSVPVSSVAVGTPNNVAIGSYALVSQQASTNAGQLVAVGGYALSSNTLGNNNIAIGYAAMQNNTTGQSNIAIGSAALTLNITGIRNVAIGDGAVNASLYGYGNTGVGASSLANITSGVASLGTIIGGSGYVNGTYTGVTFTYVTGSASVSPVATITVSGGLVTSVTITDPGRGVRNGLGGSSNTVLTTANTNLGGTGSGFSVPVSSVTTSLNNTAIGYFAGGGMLTGSGGVFIGQQAGSAETLSNKLYIANSSTSTPLIYGDFSTPALTINGSLTATGTLTTNLTIAGYVTTNSSGVISSVATIPNSSLTNSSVTIGSTSVALGATVTTVSGLTLTNTTITDPKIIRAINAQVGTTYTLILTDNSKELTMSNASPVSVFIPTNALVAIPIGALIRVVNIGAGLVTISAVTPGTTTVLSLGTVTASPTVKQNGASYLTQIAADVWEVSGDVVVTSLPSVTSVNGTTIPASSTLMANPMTTVGDIIYGGASGASTRLAGSATNNYVLTYNTSTNAPTWAASAGYSTITLGSTALASGSTVTTVSGLTLTNPTINSSTLSGTLSGSPTLSGAITFSVDALIHGITVGLGNGSSATNTALGYQALNANAAGTGNVAIGYQTLALSAGQQGNVAIGNSTLAQNTSGSQNVGVGSNVLNSNASGNFNVAIGASAMQGSNSSSAFNNTAVGWSSQNGAQTSSNNDSLGSTSFQKAIAGSQNVVIGSSALSATNNANYNTVVGTNAMGTSNTTVATFGTITGGTGYTNGTYTNVTLTFFGGGFYAPLTYPVCTIVVTGGAVTSVTLTGTGTATGTRVEAATIFTAPTANIGGTGSGFTVAVGTINIPQSNVVIGNNAGVNNLGSSNIFIGFGAGNSELGSNKLYIGANMGTTPLLLGDFVAKTLTINGQLTSADSTDITKKLIYSVAGNTTGITGTLATSFTTNKTLTFPDATGTLMVSPMTAAGDLIYGGASGASTRLAGSATNNYVLTYNTSTNAPTWAASAGYSTITLGSTSLVSGSTVTTIAGLTLTAASSATVGAKVTGAASQTADLFQILASGPTILASVTAAGILIEQQPAVTALVTSGAITLTVAQILTRITTQNQTVAATFTLPTGTLMDGGFNALFNNMSIDWSIINIGSTSGAVTMAANTAHTYIGSTSIPITTSARFRSVRAGVATWVTYRTS